MLEINRADFSEEEYKIILAIRKNIIGILYRKDECLKWIFSEFSIQGKLSLADCCKIINLSPQLIRIRAQHELFKNKVVITGLRCELPKVLDYEIFQIFKNREFNNIAEHIWKNPGIKLGHDDIVLNLISNQLVANNEGLLYMCGRTPNNNRLNWSRCWVFNE